jgi:transposase-like protein
MADTVMKGRHTPLSIGFWGAYLVATQTPGQSALQFQRPLGLSRYETAFQRLHKLRAGRVRPERDAIGSQFPVEVDETRVGGRTKGEGRGVHHKATVVGAIEVRPRKPVEKSKKHKRVVYAGRLRLRLVPGRGAKELTEFVQANVAQGAVVRTDGWKGYDDWAKLGDTHEPLVLDGDPERTDAHLPMIHIAFSNLKTWRLGTHHGVSQQHLQAYLNEFVFRFNRRFYPMTAFNSALGLAAHASAPTYEALYSGEWIHPTA